MSLSLVAPQLTTISSSSLYSFSAFLKRSAYLSKSPITFGFSVFSYFSYFSFLFIFCGYSGAFDLTGGVILFSGVAATAIFYLLLSNFLTNDLATDLASFYCSVSSGYLGFGLPYVCTYLVFDAYSGLI